MLKAISFSPHSLAQGCQHCVVNFPNNLKMQITIAICYGNNNNWTEKEAHLIADLELTWSVSKSNSLHRIAHDTVRI